MKTLFNFINKQHYQKYFLKPGYIYVSKEPVIITTILGSCVSVCLFDQKLQYGGMNHYLFPQQKQDEKPTTKYGNIAIYKLIKIFIEFGSSKKNLVAKISGGAYFKDINDSRIISDLNIKICKDILHKLKISIITEDTGGTYGRKLDFYSDTNQISIKKLIYT